MNEDGPRPILVGLTGNIATGKSAVMHMAAEKGALTIDADKVVHEILAADVQVQAAIAAAFGPEVRLPDGRIDRQALGALVFSDPAKLRRLEEIVHPAVRTEIARRVQTATTKVVMVEAIKLLEGPLHELCHQIWVTRCRAALQRQRLVICRGMDAATAAQRVEAQPRQADKVARADVVIDTNGTLAETHEQFELAWAELRPGKPRKRAAYLRRQGQPSQRPRHLETAAPVSVRRAQLADVPAILLLMRRATGDAVQMTRAELLMVLGDRSYLIGQDGPQISVVVGWYSENLVARIEQLFVHPPEAAARTGTAVLQEVERSARELMCEVILAFAPADAPATIRWLFQTAGYAPASKVELPGIWQAAADESQPNGTELLVKELRRVGG